MAVANLCFKIEGEWLTETARNRVIEDRYDHGFNILYEGLVGITTDQVITILKGDAHLTGVNDVDMIFEEDLAWKAQLDYFYAGTWVTSDGRYLRPYAIVTSWGSDDMKFADKITPDSDSQRRASGTFGGFHGEMAGRSLFYADDPQHDVLKSLRYKTDDPDIVTGRDGTVSILFKEVKNFPFQLRKACHTAQAALDQWLKFHNLEIRGYSKTFSKEWYKVRYESDDILDPAPLTNSHCEFGEFSQLDSVENTRFFNKKKDAKQRNMTIDEFEEYQRLMDDQNIPFQKRVEAMNKVFEIQKTIDSSIPAWREEIVSQANGNFIDFVFEEKEYKIPRAPFENWCLWRTDGAHLALPWNKVSPSGVKMFGDDPYHTDFLVGAGFEPDAMLSNRALSDAIFDLHRKVQEEKLGFKCAVLSGKGFVRGTVVHVITGNETIPDDAIVIVKNAGAKHLDQVLKARGLIVERGGAMAHLVTVARETEAVIVRVEKALTLYPNGTSVSINADKGEVTLYEGNMKTIWEMY